MKKSGIALLGLGYYATEQLAPAFRETQACYLAAVITGDRSKGDHFKQVYGLTDQQIYTYDQFDAIGKDPSIDIIYVVLPHHLHAEYTIKALESGKHVICEKPMASTVAEAEQMMAAAKRTGKTISIGYRLHFDPYHNEMIRLVKDKVLGKVKSIDCSFSFIPPKNVWRLSKEASGGGPLVDVGIYIIQAACYLTGLVPVAVTARSLPVTDPEKFNGIEDTLVFELEMPDGLIVHCRTSFSETSSHLRIDAENGWAELNPAFNYNGLVMKRSDGMETVYPPCPQQALQMDAIAMAIQNNEPSPVPASMGLRDMIIIQAVYEAMESGKRIPVNCNNLSQ
jgi:predicted dehydrogenase